MTLALMTCIYLITAKDPQRSNRRVGQDPFESQHFANAASI